MLVHPSHPLQQQLTPNIATDAPAAADRAPASSMTPAVSSTGTSSISISGASSSLLQQKSEEAQLCSDMVNITAAHTQHENPGGAAASSGVELRGGGGSRVLSVRQEDVLVRQALRLLMAGDGGGDSEAGKVSSPTLEATATVNISMPQSATVFNTCTLEVQGLPKTDLHF